MEVEILLYCIVFILTLQSRITHERANTYFQISKGVVCVFFAAETASRIDIERQGIRVQYPSSLRTDPLVLLLAQCIAPI